MCEYIIPIIPQLDFEKKDNAHYLFESNEGNLILNKDNKICPIKNIKIKVSNKIVVSLSIEGSDYEELFCKKNNKKPIYSREYEIRCESGNYHIILSGCYEKDSELNSGKHWVKLSASNINLIKNGETIQEGEKVNVWCILESDKISQNVIKEFEPIQLERILLKSKGAHDPQLITEPKEKFKKIIRLYEKQEESFKQLLTQSSFLFYKTDDFKQIPEEISNIEKLLMLFDPILNPIRMKIYENDEKDKLMIDISSDEKYYFNNSIFADTTYNFCNFINSTYPTYISLKNSTIDIDLILYYYVLLKNEPYTNIKIAFCSIIMEILKNFETGKTEQDNKFKDKINELFQKLKLDSLKLFEVLQPDFYNIFDEIKNDNYSKSSITLVCRYFRKNYIAALIEVYRNKTIHSGDFKINETTLNKLIDEKWKPLVKKGLSSSDELIDEIGEYIKQNARTTTSVDDITTQTQFFEFIVDIVMLKLFNVDCELENYPHFREILEKRDERPYSNELFERFELP